MKKIGKLITTLMNYPGVAVLVPNKDIKRSLIEMVGSDTYSQCPDFIWTVAEIKGMEYPCFKRCINQKIRESMRELALCKLIL